MLVFNKYFYTNKKSKLYFGDRVAVLNDFIYQTGGSTPILIGFSNQPAGQWFASWAVADRPGL
jgi:hypothetical protein